MEASQKQSQKQSVLWEQIKWKLINALQVVACSIVTAFWIPVALVVLLVTFNRRIPLMMAHHIWGPLILKICGTKLNITGNTNINFSKPYIFVMNHQSTLDIPIAFVTLKTPLHFVLKKELMFAPFVGLYCWAMGMIFINRKNKDKAKHSLKVAAQKIRNGANIIAFPEGTRSPSSQILPFKKGVFVLALEAQVSVVPLAVEGSRLAMPKNTFAFRPHEVTIKIGEPISTQGLSFENRNELIEKVRDAVVGLHDGISQ